MGIYLYDYFYPFDPDSWQGQKHWPADHMVDQTFETYGKEADKSWVLGPDGTKYNVSFHGKGIDTLADLLVVVVHD